MALLYSNVRLCDTREHVTSYVLTSMGQTSVYASTRLTQLDYSSRTAVAQLYRGLKFRGCHGFRLTLTQSTVRRRRTRHVQSRKRSRLRRTLLGVLTGHRRRLQTAVRTVSAHRLQRVLSLLHDYRVVRLISRNNNLPITFSTSVQFDRLNGQYISDTIRRGGLTFTRALAPGSVLVILSTSKRDTKLRRISTTTGKQSMPILLVAYSDRNPLTRLTSCIVATSGHRRQLVRNDRTTSLLSPGILVRILCCLLQVRGLWGAGTNAFIPTFIFVVKTPSR